MAKKQKKKKQKINKPMQDETDITMLLCKVTFLFAPGFYSIVAIRVIF